MFILKIVNFKTFLAGLIFLLAFFTFFQIFNSQAQISSIYYIGPFNSSTSSDNSSCGSRSNPCTTLSYWNSNLRSLALSGCSASNRCSVRLAPGTYTLSNIVASPYVIYEGRNADDTLLSNYNSVIIDASGISSSKVIVCDGCDFNGFQLRSLTLRNGTSPYSCAWLNTSGTSSGFEMRFVRITGCLSSGLVVGSTSTSEGINRNVRNIVIEDSSFDNNNGNGLWIAGVDEFTITRSLFNDNGPGDDKDGLHIGGSINGLIQYSEATRNGEDGFDTSRNGGSDNCPGTTHDITYIDNSAHDNSNANFSMNACSYNLTFRNNFSWGGGTGFNQYYCAHDIKFQNNTVRTSGPALQMFSGATDITTENNILETTGSGPAVFTDRTAIGVSNGSIWRNNIVRSNGATAINTNNNGDSTNPACFSDSAYTQNGGKVTQAIIGGTYSNNQLANFRSANPFPLTPGDTGANDVWGTSPSYVNSANPSPANLHLTSIDTLARDHGISFSEFTTDYDGDLRPQGTAWDIGADEVIGGTPPLSASTNTYYVDPVSGNDTNDGRTQVTAWKTIPGTRTTTNSGFLRSAWGSVSSSNHIKAGDIIEIKAGVSMTSAIGGRLVIDSIYYDHGVSTNPIIIRVSSTWGSGNFNYNASGMTIPQYSSAIFINRVNYIQIKGVDSSRRFVVSNASGGGWGLMASGISATHQQGIMLDFMEFASNSFGGMSIFYSDNFVVSNSISRNNGNIGFDVGGINDANSRDGTFIDDEAFSNGVGSTGIAHGFGLYGATNITYKRTKAYSNGRDGFDFGTTSNTNNTSATIIDSTSYNNGEDGFGANGGTTGTQSYTYINSIAYGNGTSGWDIYDAPRVNLYHVVAHNNGQSNFGGNILSYSESGFPDTYITIKNSIFYKPRYAQFGSYSSGGCCRFPIVTSSNNIYVPANSNNDVFSEDPFGTQQTYSSPPSWVSSTDKLGTAFDPGFVLAGTSNFATNDYHLIGTGSAINTGANLNSIAGVANDRDGILRSSTPEIGMYEFGGVSSTPTPSITPTPTPDTTPPVVSSVTAVNITQIDATITWTTNELSDSQVEFPTGPCPGGTNCLSPLVSALVTSHSIGLGNSLQPSTTYTYRVKSRDAAGNLATSSNNTFTTQAIPTPTPTPSPSSTPTPDTTPPTISNVNLGQFSVTINWTTNEPADSQVEFLNNVCPNVSNCLTPVVSGLRTSHSINVFDLLPNTLYTYRTRSRDASNNLAVSTNQTLITQTGSTTSTPTPTPTPDTTPPVVSSVTAVNITQIDATITWTTNELSDSQVEFPTGPCPGGTNCLSPLVSALVTSHSIGLGNSLQPSTTYTYRVKSRDAAGNLATSSNNTFTTQAIPTPTPTPTLSGLISHWKLDEGSGTSTFDSHDSNHGALVNGPIWTLGKYGSAVSFDGINDRVEVPNSSSLSATGNNITLSVWVNFSNTGTHQIFIAKPTSSTSHSSPYFSYSLHGLYVSSTRLQPRFWVTIGGVGRYVVSSVSIDASTWHHIAGVYTGTAIKIYVDGVERGSSSVTGPISSYTTPLIMGTNGGLTERFKGLLDDVRIYSRPLTSSEIIGIMNEGSTSQ